MLLAVLKLMTILRTTRQKENNKWSTKTYPKGTVFASSTEQGKHLNCEVWIYLLQNHRSHIVLVEEARILTRTFNITINCSSHWTIGDDYNFNT